MRITRIVKQLFLIFLIQQISLSSNAQIQSKNWLEPNGGGEFNEATNHICLNETNRKSIAKLIEDNIQKLNLGDRQNQSRILTEEFGWPLKPTSSLEFYDYHAISNFLDHDNTSGVLDYHCEERCYDGHKGTDFIMWPFPWYIYENELVEVVAVMDGVIVGKEDGQFDANCSLNDDALWNAVYVMHDNGYIAWYAHLKENSLTTKTIGDSVVQGEYLGLVASSGYSDTPHLHFEVYNNLGELVDPYSGNCNTEESLWESQRAYRQPTINAVLTHSKVPEFGCPTTNEQPNLSVDFMMGDTVYVAAYFHDQLASQNYNYSLIHPDGSVWQNWEHSSDETYNISWWYWYFYLPPNSQGTWLFKVEGNGQTSEHAFNYGIMSSIEENEPSNFISIYPNPTNSTIHISEKVQNVDRVYIFNALGEIIINSNQWEDGINFSGYPNGIYYVSIIIDNNIEFVEKIIKY